MALFYTDQRQRKKGHPWNRFAVETRKETIQPMRTLAGLGHHDFIARQQVGRPALPQLLAEKHPKQRAPRYHRAEKPLHRPIAPAFPTPARYPLHGHTPAHYQHGPDDAAELSCRCPRQTWLKAL